MPETTISKDTRIKLGLVITIAAGASIVAVDRVSLANRLDRLERWTYVIARSMLKFQKTWYRTNGQDVPAGPIQTELELIGEYNEYEKPLPLDPAGRDNRNRRRLHE